MQACLYFVPVHNWRWGSVCMKALHGMRSWRALLCLFRWNVNLNGVSGVLYLVYDSLESLGVVDCEVSEDFAVDFDTCFVNQAHELGI